MKIFQSLLFVLFVFSINSFPHNTAFDSSGINFECQVDSLNRIKCQVDSLLTIAKQTTRFNDQILTNTNTYVEKISFWLTLGLGIISFFAVGGGTTLAIMSRRNEKYYFEEVLKRIDRDDDARIDFVKKLLGHKDITSYILSLIESTTKDYLNDIKEIKESLNE